MHVHFDPKQPPPASRSGNLALASLVGATLVQSAILQWLDRPLKTGEAPLGIVSFELAGDLPTAERILDSWDDEARRHAAISLSLDYAYLASYSTAIALACLRLAARLEQCSPRLATAGIALAYGQWLAAGLDAAENYGLIRLLFGSGARVWPRLARWCAVPKFVLVVAGLSYVAVGTAVLVLGGKRHLTV